MRGEEEEEVLFRALRVVGAVVESILLPRRQQEGDLCPHQRPPQSLESLNALA
jgi:hypothetical protein